MMEGAREMDLRTDGAGGQGKAPMDTLAILGPGVLGLSAAQWAAERGLEVRLLGRDLEHAARGRAEIERRWEISIQRGRFLTQDHAAASSRLQADAFGPAALSEVTAFLEAVPEDPDSKVSVLRDVARWSHPDLLCLSGTSALPISGLARGAGLEGRLLGFHLFVPVTRMAVVEIAVPAGTSAGTVCRARSLAESLGKRPVQVRDQPGFAAARMALAQGLEAMRMVESGVASAEDLDALMTLGYGHPAGPLELSDRVGLHLRLRIAEGIHRATGDPIFCPPDLLRDMVARGETGLRAGIGFYRWDASGRHS